MLYKPTEDFSKPRTNFDKNMPLGNQIADNRAANSDKSDQRSPRSECNKDSTRRSEEITRFTERKKKPPDKSYFRNSSMVTSESYLREVSPEKLRHTSQESVKDRSHPDLVDIGSDRGPRRGNLGKVEHSQEQKLHILVHKEETQYLAPHHEIKISSQRSQEDLSEVKKNPVVARGSDFIPQQEQPPQDSHSPPSVDLWIDLQEWTTETVKLRKMFKKATRSIRKACEQEGESQIVTKNLVTTELNNLWKNLEEFEEHVTSYLDETLSERRLRKRLQDMNVSCLFEHLSKTSGLHDDVSRKLCKLAKFCDQKGFERIVQEVDKCYGKRLLDWQAKLQEELTERLERNKKLREIVAVSLKPDSSDTASARKLSIEYPSPRSQEVLPEVKKNPVDARGSDSIHQQNTLDLASQREIEFQSLMESRNLLRDLKKLRRIVKSYLEETLWDSLSRSSLSNREDSYLMAHLNKTFQYHVDISRKLSRLSRICEPNEFQMIEQKEYQGYVKRLLEWKAKLEGERERRTRSDEKLRNIVEVSLKQDSSDTAYTCNNSSEVSSEVSSIEPLTSGPDSDKEDSLVKLETPVCKERASAIEDWKNESLWLEILIGRMNSKRYLERPPKNSLTSYCEAIERAKSLQDEENHPVESSPSSETSTRCSEESLDQVHLYQDPHVLEDLKTVEWSPSAESTESKDSSTSLQSEEKKICQEMREPDGPSGSFDLLGLFDHPSDKGTRVDSLWLQVSTAFSSPRNKEKKKEQTLESESPRTDFSDVERCPNLAPETTIKAEDKLLVDVNSPIVNELKSETKDWQLPATEVTGLQDLQLQKEEVVLVELDLLSDENFKCLGSQQVVTTENNTLTASESEGKFQDEEDFPLGPSQPSEISTSSSEESLQQVHLYQVPPVLGHLETVETTPSVDSSEMEDTRSTSESEVVDYDFEDWENNQELRESDGPSGSLEELFDLSFIERDQMDNLSLDQEDQVSTASSSLIETPTSVTTKSMPETIERRKPSSPSLRRQVDFIGVLFSLISIVAFNNFGPEGFVFVTILFATAVISCMALHDNQNFEAPDFIDHVEFELVGPANVPGPPQSSNQEPSSQIFVKEEPKNADLDSTLLGDTPGVTSLKEEKTLPTNSVTLLEETAVTESSFSVSDPSRENRIIKTAKPVVHYDSKKPKKGPDKNRPTDLIFDSTSPRKGPDKTLRSETLTLENPQTLRPPSSLTPRRTGQASAQDLHLDPAFDSRTPRKGPDKAPRAGTLRTEQWISSTDSSHKSVFDSRRPRKGPDKVLHTRMLQQKMDRIVVKKSFIVQQACLLTPSCVGSNPTDCASRKMGKPPDGVLHSESRFDSRRPRKGPDKMSKPKRLIRSCFSPQHPKRGPDKSGSRVNGRPKLDQKDLQMSST